MIPNLKQRLQFLFDKCQDIDQPRVAAEGSLKRKHKNIAGSWTLRHQATQRDEDNSFLCIRKGRRATHVPANETTGYNGSKDKGSVLVFMYRAMCGNGSFPHR